MDDDPVVARLGQVWRARVSEDARAQLAEWRKHGALVRAERPGSSGLSLRRAFRHGSASARRTR